MLTQATEFKLHACYLTDTTPAWHTQPLGHTWSPRIPKQLDLSHLLWVWEPLGCSKACFPGTSKSSGILQALPFHSFLSLLKKPTWAGAAVCGLQWGTTFQPKKALSKITVFFNGCVLVELISLTVGSLRGPVNMPQCQHRGRGGSSSSSRSCLHIRKAANHALSRDVTDSCLHFLHKEPPTAP